MKKLFYNPIELVSGVHLVSNQLNIDVTYDLDSDMSEYPYSPYELLKFAKNDKFEVVDVCFTAHNCAYIRDTKTLKREDVIGWISLKGIEDGGGYLKDKYNLFEL